MSNITRDDPHLTIDNLKHGTDYRFRFTPVSSEKSQRNETNSSQLSLVLDVKTPLAQQEQSKFEKIYRILFIYCLCIANNENSITTSPQFSIQKLDSTSVLIEAVVPEEESTRFDDVFDVFSKKETVADDWSKVCQAKRF